MARAGMANLIGRLRRSVDDAGTAVWSDDELQAALDKHRLRLDFEPLCREVTHTAGGSAEYRYYHSYFGDYEEGEDALVVQDSAGAERGTAEYTMDYAGGLLTMTADQHGTALYLTGWSYDLNGAAADCWRERTGKVASFYNVQLDGHGLSRSQWFEHCERMAETYARQARPVKARMWNHGVLE